MRPATLLLALLLAARESDDAYEDAGTIYRHGPYQTLLADGRIRVLVALEGTDRGLAVTYDPSTGEAGDVTPLDSIRGPDGLLRADTRDRL